MKADEHKEQFDWFYRVAMEAPEKVADRAKTFDCHVALEVLTDAADKLGGMDSQIEAIPKSHSYRADFLARMKRAIRSVDEARKVFAKRCGVPKRPLRKPRRKR